MSVQLYLIVFVIAILGAFIASAVITPSVLRREYERQLKLDVTPKQMKNTEGKIKKFYSESGLSTNASIYEIAQVLNIVEGGIDANLTERARLCEPDENGKMKVLFKKGLTKEERKFDFAHECAHRINGDPIPNTRPGGHDKPKVEQIADYTAAALLMPLEEVYNFLVEKDYIASDKNKRYNLLCELCKIYGVSEVIALRRIKEVALLKNIQM